MTAYIEKHEFSFDAVLHDHVTDDEVTGHTFYIMPSKFQPKYFLLDCN